MSVIPDICMQDAWYHLVCMPYLGVLCAKLGFDVNYMEDLHELC